MALIAIISFFLLGAVLLYREHQLNRERAAVLSNLQEAFTALDACHIQIKRTNEDLFVMQTVLCERHILDENDLVQARMRLIEIPRRLAEERAATARHLKVSPTQLIFDPLDPTIQ